MAENRGGIGPTRTVFLMPIRNLTHGEDIPSRGFWFPVAPSEYGKAGSSNWITVNIVGLGEVAHRGGPNLESVEIESFFPGEFNPALCRALRSPQDFQDPDEACKKLERIRDQQVIFQLNVGAGDIIQEKVRITDFAWSETAGRPNDRQFSIRFETWRPQQVERRGEINLPPIPKAYRLRPGEDLDDAALRIFGTLSKVGDIEKANKVKPVGTDKPGGGLGVVGRAAGAPRGRGASPGGQMPGDPLYGTGPGEVIRLW